MSQLFLFISSTYGSIPLIIYLVLFLISDLEK